MRTFSGRKNIKDRRELFILPPYSPQSNPDELVWNHLKNHGSGTSAIEALGRRVHARTRTMRELPALVRSLFSEPHVRYAAAA